MSGGGCRSTFLGTVGMVDINGTEGWLQVQRRWVKSDIIQFCSRSGRCFKCGLKGHCCSKC